MNKVIKVLLILAIFLGITGGVLYTGAYLATGTIQPIFFDDHHESEIVEQITMNENSNVISNEKYQEEFDDIQSIDLQADYAYIEIIPSNRKNIQVTKKQTSSELSISHENQKLTIQLKNEDLMQRDVLQIYVPLNILFTDSSIHLTKGELDVEGVQFVQSKIEVEKGSLELEDCVIENSSLINQGGEVSFEGWLVQDILIQGNGSIEIDCYNPKDELSYSFLGNNGRIEIDDCMIHQTEYLAPNEKAFLTVENSKGHLSLDYGD